MTIGEISISSGYRSGGAKMKVFEKLLAVQAELNAPKNRQNKFGGYFYRSCEDILEALKPILKKVKATIKLSDQIVQIGERYYVNAIAYFYDIESDDGVISAEAYAREPEEKKGMDAAQITGTASSYARKYALNALLLIDDAKDPDTDEYRIEQDAKMAKADKKKTSSKKDETDASVLDSFVNDGQLKTLEMMLGKAEITQEKFCQIYNLAMISELPADKYESAVHKLEEAIKVKGGK